MSKLIKKAKQTLNDLELNSCEKNKYNSKRYIYKQNSKNFSFYTPVMKCNTIDIQKNYMILSLGSDSIHDEFRDLCDSIVKRIKKITPSLSELAPIVKDSDKYPPSLTIKFYFNKNGITTTAFTDKAGRALEFDDSLITDINVERTVIAHVNLYSVYESTTSTTVQLIASDVVVMTEPRKQVIDAEVIEELSQAFETSF